ncbi:MAG: phage terminase large subunit [Candidatus Omnitrophica bacterium]|nr:phage terminase large subunit [Candidatus Omnitrophota bacterium]MDD5488292.1 phage terminase large subunit [Candidatus Omnitrophota bacterium]
MKKINKNKITILMQAELIKKRREKFTNFADFRSYYFSHYNKLKDGPFQTEFTADLQKLKDNRGSKLAIAAPRESAKSTILTLQYVIYCVCYDLEKFILIVSNTSEQAATFLENIKSEIENNERLLEDFPEVCENWKVPTPAKWQRKEIITKNGIKILALGASQQVRGLRNREIRPSLIIADDVENNDTCLNPEVMDKLQSALTNAVFKAGSAETNIVLIGTIHHYHSLLSQFTSQDAYPGWRKQVYRAVVKWSDGPKRWERWTHIYNNRESYKGEYGPEAAKQYFERYKSKMLKGTEVLWPERRSYYELMVMREQEGHVSFDAEMQNEPVNPKDCIFNLDDIHFWDDKFENEEELLASFQGDALFFGACDPSLGTSKRKGDFSAIITVAKDMKTKKMYVLDAHIDRLHPDKTIGVIVKYHDLRGYKKFRVESNQFQALMLDDLRERIEANEQRLGIEGVNHTSHKYERIEALQPLIKSGTLQFSRRHITLLEQLKQYPKGRHDDGPDALEMAVTLAQSYKGGCCLYTWDVYPEEPSRAQWPLPKVDSLRSM